MFQVAIYFAQKLTDYMFKQRVEVVVLFTFVISLGIAVTVMWLKIADMQVEGKMERLEIRKECAKDIDDLRRDLKDCQSRNDTLRSENTVLHRRLSALEERLKKN